MPDICFDVTIDDDEEEEDVEGEGEERNDSLNVDMVYDNIDCLHCSEKNETKEDTEVNDSWACDDVFYSFKTFNSHSFDIRSLTDCKYFLHGLCAVSNCSFRHPSGPLHGSKVCKKWKIKSCFDINCPYAHPKLTSVSSLREYSPNQCDVECKYFRAGSCRLGSSCTYLHNLEPLMSQRKRKHGENILEKYSLSKNVETSEISWKRAKS